MSPLELSDRKQLRKWSAFVSGLEIERQQMHVQILETSLKVGEAYLACLKLLWMQKLEALRLSLKSLEGTLAQRREMQALYQ